MLDLYIPKLEELWFQQKLLSDPETMFYNKDWDVTYAGYHRDTGCVDFPQTQWAEWYADWIGQEPKRFFAYVRRKADGAWIGTVEYHYEAKDDWCEMGIVLYAPYRGMGYAVPALKLMLDHAFRDCKVSRIHNDFELSRNEVSAWKTHFSAGFREVSRENGWLTVMLTRDQWLEDEEKTKMDMKSFWAAVLRQDADAIRPYFHPEAYVNWHNTNEHFTVEEFIRANCEYPGQWEGEVEQIISTDDCMITATHVHSVDGKISCHATSFIHIADGRITAMDEYWGDDGQVPQWRQEKHIGTPISKENQ